MDWAKRKCAELGFKTGTEKFGACVLQLSRDDPRPNPPAAEPPKADVPPLASGDNAAQRQTDFTSFKDCDECPEMVKIPSGSFLMGSNSPNAHDDEKPQRNVTIKAFALGKFEVTQEQWLALMGNLPSEVKGKKLPVTNITKVEALEFLKRLSAKTGKKYRLPSEAEWEYAARGVVRKPGEDDWSFALRKGGQSEYFFGDDLKELGKYAWTADNSGGTLHEAGLKEPNPFGLHDIYGNVDEMVMDCWAVTYKLAPVDGSAFFVDDCTGVYRGGSAFDRNAIKFRSSFRATFRAIGPYSYRHIGFRVARDD